MFFFPYLTFIDKIAKTPEKTDEVLFKSSDSNKGVTVSTINFNIKMTAAKTQEMILKKLRRRTKDAVGVPRSSQVRHFSGWSINLLMLNW